MSNGPNIQGSVTIGTTSIDRAIKAIQKLEKTVRAASQKSSSDINKMVSSLNSQAQASNIASQAVNREAESVRNASDAKSRSIRTNQEVSTSLAANVRAINQVEVSQQKLENRIRTSALAESEKSRALRDSQAAMRNAIRNIEQYGAKSTQAAQGVGQFRTATTSASIALGNANKAFRNQQIDEFRNSMRNMTGSVQLALGPLSGIASRITALVGIFIRGGAAIATFLGSFTAFTVSLTRGLAIAREAETQFLRTESVIRSMGVTANVTADELFEMGYSIAQATLLSASEAREAALALSNFGAVASEQFERVVITAQGVSEQMGGGLVENTRMLGRVMQDPVSRMNDLERRMGRLDRATRNQVTELALAGERYEANEVLLGALADKFDFAVASAGGLDGAIDGLGDMFNQFYEDALLSSGATEEATNQVIRFKESLEELLDGEFGRRISNAYVSSLRATGNAVNFVIDNAKLLTAAFLVLAGGAAVRLTMALGRMMVRLIPLGPMMLNATRGATSITGALVAMRAALMAASPALIAMRVAVLALAPLIGFMAHRFLFSGESAEKAETPIRDYNDSLQDLMKTFKELKGFDPELDESTSHIQNLMQELDRVASDLDLAEQIMDSTQSSAVKNVLDDLSEHFEGTMEDIRDAVLAEQVDGEFGAMSDNLAAKFESLDHTVQDSLVTYFQASQRMDEMSEKGKILADALRIHEQAGRDAAQATSEFRQQVENSIEQTDRLAESFDRDQERLNKLNEELRNAKRAKEIFNQVDEDSTEYEEATRNLERLRRIIEQIKSEIEDMQDDGSDALGLGSGFQSLMRNVNSTRRETELLNAEFRQLKGEAIDLDQMRMMDQIARSAEQARDNISRLNTRELQEMAKRLEVDIQFDKENVEEYRDAVTEAYNAVISGEIESQAAYESKIDAQERLNDALREEPARIQEIANKRKSLIEDAETAGAGSETFDQINAQYQKERQMLEDHARSLADIRLGASVSEIEEMRRTREEELQEMYTGEEEQYQEHLDRLRESAQRAKVFAQFVGGAEVANEALQNVMNTMETANRESADSYKRLALMQATVAGALGIAKVWSEHAANPLIATALSGLVATSVGAQYAAIQNANYATGGYVSGKGTSTSDSIAANLSNGEYVINAAAVRKLGIGNLDAMNEGRMPVSLNTGGYIGQGRPSGDHSDGGGKVSIQIIDQRSGNASPVETEEGFGPDGERRIRILVRDVVRDQMSNGDFDRQQKQRYNNRAKAKRR